MLLDPAISAESRAVVTPRTYEGWLCRAACMYAALNLICGARNITLSIELVKEFGYNAGGTRWCINISA